MYGNARSVSNEWYQSRKLICIARGSAARNNMVSEDAHGIEPTLIR
jgi:hypothetical protein